VDIAVGSRVRITHNLATELGKSPVTTIKLLPQTC
jgi:hypothetical protein